FAVAYVKMPVVGLADGDAGGHRLSVITERAARQCRLRRHSHVSQSDPSPCLCAGPSRRCGAAEPEGSSTRLSNSAAAKCGKAAAVPTSASVQPNSISTTRSPAQGADNQRRADIDQKLYAAAHVPGIDLHPAGAHLAQLQQHCRAFFLGHAREYQKAGGVRVVRRNQHRMMGVSQSTHTCPLTASACAVFRQ
ncbi:MAG: hypothetical protein WA858_13330, partial [Xanthobacteraceae bacterium]